MSAVPAARSSAKRFSLEVSSGLLRGQRFFYAKNIVTIGRTPENDLPLDKDLKVSRQHVEIRNQDGQLTIHNVSEKNQLLVNGQNVRNAVLSSECKIQIGDTELIFRPETLYAVPGTSTGSRPLPGYRPLSAVGSPPPMMPRPSAPRRAPSSSGGSKLFLYTIIGLLVVGAGLFSSGGLKRKPPADIRTSEDVEKDLEASKDSVAEMEKRLEQEGHKTPQYEMAQQHYIRGFRDYRQGQYSRAIISMQAALAFYPQHELARHYLTLAQKKLDEMVKEEMVLGVKYRGQGNFRLCAAMYAKVLQLINDDSNNENFKEASQYKRECELQQRDRY